LLLLPLLPYVATALLPFGQEPGWLLFIYLFFAFPFWLPNTLFWLGLYLLARGRTGWVLFVGTLAFLIASLPMLDTGLWRLLGMPPVGSMPGYLAWVSSMCLLIVAAYLAPLCPRPPDSDELYTMELEDDLRRLKAENRALRDPGGREKPQT